MQGEDNDKGVREWSYWSLASPGQLQAVSNLKPCVKTDSSQNHQAGRLPLQQVLPMLTEREL